eukprot:146387-Prorocentrum_lima.AAC.1
MHLHFGKLPFQLHSYSNGCLEHLFDNLQTCAPPAGRRQNLSGNPSNPMHANLPNMPRQLGTTMTPGPSGYVPKLCPCLE